MTQPRAAIVFNASTGSDTAASGLGPAMAVSGSAAAHTGGSASTTITLTNTPDLSGVVAGDLLWLNTAAGRQYSVIASVDDGADTVTVDDSFNIAGASAVDYAIGGQRATFDHADSRTIFVDRKAGWIVETETNQTVTTSALACTGAGDTTNGEVVTRGATGSTPVVNQTANAAVFSVEGNLQRIKNLQLTNSNGTKTAARGVLLSTASSFFVAEDVIFGDSTNQLLNAMVRGAGTPIVTILGGTIKNCTSDGLTGAFLSNVTLTMIGVMVKDNGGDGVEIGAVGGSAAPILLCNVFHNNAAAGVNVADATGSMVTIVGNVFDGNGTHGLNFANAVETDRAIVLNNIFSNNTTTGIAAVAGSEVRKVIIDFNAFYNNGAHRSNISAGANDVELTADPYTNLAGDDFSLNSTAGGGADCRAVGYPASVGGVSNYVDLGALQRQEAVRAARNIQIGSGVIIA